ncbi:MAG: hypothetical protein K5891_04680 [Lachnospiraceae bacterium]|nr:hypothetical protein [Lachnospiraceae bacterium]
MKKTILIGKMLCILGLGASVLAVSMKADAHTEYHAYLGLRSPAGTERFAWDAPEYGGNYMMKDAETGEYKSLPGIFYDTVVEEDGLVSVSASMLSFPGDEWEDSQCLDEIFVSSTLPGAVTVTDVHLLVDNREVEIEPQVLTDAAGHMYLQVQKSGENDKTGYYGVPVSELTVTFQLSGLTGEAVTEPAAQPEAPGTEAVTDPAPARTAATLLIVSGCVLFAAGLLILILALRKITKNGDV